MLKWNPDRMPVSACLNMYTYLQFVAFIWTVKRFLTLCFEKCYTKYITISRKYYFHRLNTSVSVFCLKAVIKPALTAIFLLWTTVVSMCAPLSVSSILQSIEMLQTTLKLRWYNFLLMKLRILLKKLFGDFWRIVFYPGSFFKYFFPQTLLLYSLPWEKCPMSHSPCILWWSSPACLRRRKNKINNKILHVNKQIFWNHSFDIRFCFYHLSR